MPWNTIATANIAAPSAIAKRPSDTSAMTLATNSTGRRPSESDRPPVGSSSASTTNPWTEKTRPISVRLSPRDNGHSTKIGMSSPTGSQRRPTSTR